MSWIAGLRDRAWAVHHGRVGSARAAILALACAAALAFHFGCGHSNRTYAGAVQRQHAALYGCENGNVTVERIGARTYSAVGCDRSAIYACRRGANCVQEGQVALEYQTTRYAPPPTTVIVQQPAPQRHVEVPQQAGAPQPRAQAPSSTEARRNPQTPEINGTRREAELICAGQGGRTVASVESGNAVWIQCYQAGARLFAGRMDARVQRIDQVDSWLEGASIVEVRDRFQARWGAGLESMSGGVRRWIWFRPDATWSIQLTDRGVRIRAGAPAPPTLPSPVSQSPDETTVLPPPTQQGPANG